MTRTTRIVRSLSVVVVAVGSVMVSGVVTAAPSVASVAAIPMSPNGTVHAFTFAAGQALEADVMGLAGEQLTITASAGTFAPACALHMTVHAPDTSVLGGPVCAGKKASVAIASLPVDGTYTVELVAGATKTGSVNVRATSSGGPLSVTPGADAVTVKWPLETNEDLRFGFVSAANAHYSAILSGGRFQSTCQLSAQFLDATGNPVGTTAVACAGNGAFVDVTEMPSAGTYSLQLLGYDRTPVSVRLYRVVDQTGTISTDGTPTPVNLDAPGQSARFTFAGIAGKKSAFVIASGRAEQLTLFRPDGSQFSTADFSYLASPVLDVSGTWTIVVKSCCEQAITETLQAYTFSGASGDSRSVSVTVSTFPGCTAMIVSLVRPNTVPYSSTAVCGSTASLGPGALDATGTWTVLIDPQGPGTGSATVSVS